MHATTILFGSSWIDTLNHVSWWRHQMETFSTLLAFCAGNSLVTGEFPAQRPLTRSFYVFFDLRLKQQLSKQWRRWWFETRSCSIWRHCNAVLLPCHHVCCMYWGHLGLFYVDYILYIDALYGRFNLHIYLTDQICEYVFYVFAVLGSQAFPLKSYCGVDREPHCFYICVYQRCPQVKHRTEMWVFGIFSQQRKSIWVLSQFIWTPT